MVFVLVLLTAVAILGPVPGYEATAREQVAGPVPAEVLDVIDGDTLAVRARVWIGQTIETRVRINDLDTPEIRGKCSREKEMAVRARSLIKRLIGTAPVVLRDIENDKYGGRVLARVESADGVDLARALIEAGLGRNYSGGSRQPWCEVATRP